MIDHGYAICDAIRPASHDHRRGRQRDSSAAGGGGGVGVDRKRSRKGKNAAGGRTADNERSKPRALSFSEWGSYNCVLGTRTFIAIIWKECPYVGSGMVLRKRVLAVCCVESRSSARCQEVQLGGVKCQ